MESALVLLLLLGLSPAVSRGQTGPPVLLGDDIRGAGSHTVPGLSVLWDELLGLKELVLSLKAAQVEQRQAFRRVESRLRDGELRDGAQRGEPVGLAEVSAEVLALQWRMNSSENSVEELKRRNTALAAELPFLQTRLRSSESAVEQLRRKSAVLAVRLCSTETLVEELMKQTSASPASNSSSPPDALEQRLDVHLKELNASTQAFYHRLNSLEDKLNTSAQRHELSDIQDQVSEISSRLNSSQLQRHLHELSGSAADQSSRLRLIEGRVEELKTENTHQSVQLSLMESRLRNSHNNTAALEARLRSTETQVEQLENQTTALEVRLRAGQKQLEDLKMENTVQSFQRSALESRLTDRHNNITGLQVRLRVTETHLEQLENLTAVQSVQLSLMESRQTNSHNCTAALEVRLRSAESHMEQLENHTAGLEARLGTNERQLEDLKTENTDLEVRLGSSESRLENLESASALLDEIVSRLEAAESLDSELQAGLNRTHHLLQRHMAAQVDEVSSLSDAVTALKDQNDALEARLRSSEMQLEQLENHTTVFSFRLNETHDRLQKLKNSNSELKVAFSAGLTDSGSVGPFDEETTLIFSKTITNVGQAYDQTAGVFTAPLRGLYFFSFTAADYLEGYMGVYLYRNDRPILFNLDLNDHGGYASTSNGVALQLDEGDEVRLSLPASYRLYDDARNFSVFSGFLLFPL